MEWTPPDPREVVRRLEEIYGPTTFERKMEPMDELISCVLSQHTSDAISYPTFYKMKERYPTWEEVLSAPVEELAETIKGAGLSNQKSKRIQDILRRIEDERGEFSIDFLRDLPIPEARRWLMSLPGIGPKCAAITLCFAMGLPVMPVDTHVFRVGWRLGYYDKKIGEAKAHEVFPRFVPDDLVYCFHVCLIDHGRKICKAPIPRCEICPLQSICRYYQIDVKEKNARTSP